MDRSTKGGEGTGNTRGGHERIGLQKISPSPYGNQQGGEKERGRPTEVTTRKGGGGGIFARLHPDHRGPKTQGGLWGMDALQHRQSPSQGNQGQRGVSRVVA